MKQSAKNYKRIVVKVGSSLFCSAMAELCFDALRELSRELVGLVADGREVVVVSSGAIAMGMSILGLRQRPSDLAMLQAAAAVGQHELMSLYSKFLKEHNLSCAQILLTWEDFSNRRRYLNARNTINSLLRMKRVIPIINENDTISTEEIKFGDNDRLSSLVASLISADLLIILSDVDGLLDRENKVIRVVDAITPAVLKLASPTTKKSCVGGMVTKLEAAAIALDKGIPCVIANGRNKNILASVIKNPEQAGTLFVPKKGLTSKQHWIVFGAKPKGKIIVDNGARQALLKRKSLLAVGIVSLEGQFSSGDIISIGDTGMVEFARGKVSVSSEDLEKVLGKRFDREVVHSDNIVLL